MSKAYDKVMAGLGDARGYLKGERDGFAVHEIEVPEPDVVAIPRQDGALATGFCQEYRRSAWYSQELGAETTPAGGVGTRASCVDRKAPVDCSGRTRSLSRTLSVGLPGRLKSSHTRFQYAQRLREPGIVFGLPASKGEGFLHEQEARGKDDAGRGRPATRVPTLHPDRNSPRRLAASSSSPGSAPGSAWPYRLLRRRGFGAGRIDSFETHLAEQTSDDAYGA